MLREFVELRLEMAVQMLENLHNDLCNEDAENISRETIDELNHHICELRTFISKFKKGSKS